MAATAPAARLTVNPLDILDLDARLGHEERQVRDMVRGWVADRVLPDIGEWLEQRVLPRELAAHLGAQGLLGMHLEGYTLILGEVIAGHRAIA